MSKKTADPGSNGATTKSQGRKQLVPPDERFWQKYSPHHEAPLSGASSLFLHIGCYAVIALLALWYGRRLADSERPLPADVVAIGSGEEGGGGDTHGSEGGAGKVSPKEDVEDATSHPNPQPTPTPRVDLSKVDIDPLEAPELKDASGRFIEDMTESVQALDKMSKEKRTQLFKGLKAENADNSLGKGGSGQGGGKDKGIGTATGSGSGIGGTISQRQKRIMRWTLMFSTLNGDDYRKQLADLGAILAVPEPSGEFRILRDLRRIPATGEIEDITTINRIFWVDDKPESVRSLAMSLRLNPTPPQIVAFFPPELEQKLLRLEKMYRGREEHQIKETRFNVYRNPDGTYAPKVVGQR